MKTIGIMYLSEYYKEFEVPTEYTEADIQQLAEAELSKIDFADGGASKWRVNSYQNVDDPSDSGLLDC